MLISNPKLKLAFLKNICRQFFSSQVSLSSSVSFGDIKYLDRSYVFLTTSVKIFYADLRKLVVSYWRLLSRLFCINTSWLDWYLVVLAANPFIDNFKISPLKTCKIYLKITSGDILGVTWRIALIIINLVKKITSF